MRTQDPGENQGFTHYQETKSAMGVSTAPSHVKWHGSSACDTGYLSQNPVCLRQPILPRQFSPQLTVIILAAPGGGRRLSPRSAGSPLGMSCPRCFSEAFHNLRVWVFRDSYKLTFSVFLHNGQEELLLFYIKLSYRQFSDSSFNIKRAKAHKNLNP